MPTYEASHQGYLNLWTKAKVLPRRQAEVDRVAQRILANRKQYDAVEAATRVPWYLVGALHQRESSGDFHTHLHNGDSLSEYTVHVPAHRPQVGHGPPFTWIESAIDALTMRGLEKIPSWPIERVLYEAEAYNGWGYTAKGVNSPYVWGATNLQQPGKYIADHVWSATAEDTQLGVAAILKGLSTILQAQSTTQEQPKMATTTPTSVPALPMHDPIPDIIKALEAAESILSKFGMLIPAPWGTIAQAAVPILQELLQMVEDTKTKSGVDLFQAIFTRIETIAQKGKIATGVVQQVAALTPPTPSPAIAQQTPTG
jgi:lysozyme family protein